MPVPSSPPYELMRNSGVNSTSSGDTTILTAGTNQVITILGFSGSVIGGSQNCGWHIDGIYGSYNRYENEAFIDFVGGGRVVIQNGQALKGNNNSGNSFDWNVSYIVRDYNAAIPSTAPYEIAKGVTLSKSSTGSTTMLTTTANQSATVLSLYCARRNSMNVGCGIGSRYIQYNKNLDDGGSKFVEAGRVCVPPSSTFWVTQNSSSEQHYVLSYIIRDYG